MTRRLTPALLAGLITLTAAGQATGRSGLLIAGGGCFAVWLLTTFNEVQRRELPFLTSACLTSLAVLWLKPNAASQLAGAALQGTGFSALILGVGFLQGPADRSPLMRQAGELLIRQGPGRRYIALCSGGFLMATVLNLGAMSLLAGLLHRSNTLEAAGGERRIRDIRERRMGTALTRGFSCMPLWAPTSVSISIILTLVPGVGWQQVAPWGFALAWFWIGAGWLLDRLSWPPSQRLRPEPPAGHYSAAAVLLPLCAIILALVVTILGLRMLTHWNLSTVVMMVVPCAAFIWFFLQSRRFGAPTAARLAVRGLWRHCANRLPRSRYEAVMLFSAGVIGANIATLVPAESIRALLEAVHLTGLPLLLVLVALIAAAAHLGLGPIVPIVLIFPALLQITPLPVPLLPLALSGICGWALGVGASPFSAALLILAGTIGRPPQLVGWVWNGLYSLVAYLLIIVLLLIVLVVH